MVPPISPADDAPPVLHGGRRNTRLALIALALAVAVVAAELFLLNTEVSRLEHQPHAQSPGVAPRVADKGLLQANGSGHAAAQLEVAIEKASAKAAQERLQDDALSTKGLADPSSELPATDMALHGSSPSIGYGGIVAAKVKSNIVFPDSVIGNPRAVVQVLLAPNGTITRLLLIESSGNRDWDEAVGRAVRKSLPLPGKVDGQVPPELTISIRPQD